MPDYKKELTRLFQKYNPDKVKDVDALLHKFAGREPELIETIHRKYGGAVVVEEERSSRKPTIILLLAILMAFLAGGSWYAASTGMFDFGKPDGETELQAEGNSATGGNDAGREDKLADAGGDEAWEDDGYGNANPDDDAAKVTGNGTRQAGPNAGTNRQETPNTADEQTSQPRSGDTNSGSGVPMEYGVQIGLFSVPENAEVRKMLGDDQRELNILPTATGKYMYVVGTDTELGAARQRRDALRKKAFPDAFVIGLRKGKRVDIFKD